MPSETRDIDEVGIERDIEDESLNNNKKTSSLTNSIKFHDALESYKENLVNDINKLDEKLESIDSDMQSTNDIKEIHRLEKRKQELESRQKKLRQKGMDSLLYPERFELKDGQIIVTDKKSLDNLASKLNGDEKIPLNDTQNKMSVLADKERKYALPRPTPEGVVVLGGVTLIDEDTRDIYEFESQKIKNSDNEPLVWMKARKIKDGYVVGEDEEVFKELGINPDTIQHGTPGVLEESEYAKLKAKYDVDVEKLRKEHTKNEVNVLNQIKASNLRENINRGQIKQKRQMVLQDKNAGLILASETLEAKKPQDILDNAAFDQKIEVRKMEQNEVRQMAAYNGLKAREKKQEELNEDQEDKYRKSAKNNPDLARADAQESYEIASYKPDGSLGKSISANGFANGNLDLISGIDYGPAAESAGAGMAQVIETGGNDVTVKASRAQADAEKGMKLKASTGEEKLGSDNQSFKRKLIQKTMSRHKISGSPSDPKLTGNFGNTDKKSVALKDYEKITQAKQQELANAENTQKVKKNKKSAM